MKTWLDDLKPGDPVVVESDRIAELRYVGKIRETRGHFKERVICIKDGGAFTSKGRGQGVQANKWLSKATVEKIKSLGDEKKSRY